MAFNSLLDIEITEVQQTAISTDLQTSKTTLNNIATVLLNEDEREHLNGINNERLPYVQRAVEEFAPAYSDLVGKKVSAARATRLFDSFIYLRQLEGELKEFEDRRKDLSDNIEDLLYDFLREMYVLAKQYDGVVPGADVVKTYLAELFEGQGVAVGGDLDGPTP